MFGDQESSGFDDVTWLKKRTHCACLSRVMDS